MPLKTTVSIFLITCLLAIFLHGVGTNEHSFNAQGIESTVVSVESGAGDLNTNSPSLGASCEICEVVHQYIALDANKLVLPKPLGAAGFALLSSPAGRQPGGILPPPIL